MPVLLVLASTGAWLLLGAGIMKVVRPEATGVAIEALMGVGQTRIGGRLLGIAEIVISLGFIVWPGMIPGLFLGLVYALIFASALVLRRRDTECGCFGVSSTRVSGAHLAVALVGSLAAFGLVLVGYAGTDMVSRILVVASIPAAMGAYALISPLVTLRTRLADLRA